MKRLMLTSLIAGVLLLPADAAIRGRQGTQKCRIRQGAATGTLTVRESARLGRSWGNLNRSIHRDRVDGGGLTKKERVKIHHQQDRLSRRIFRQKHDRQSRPR